MVRCESGQGSERNSKSGGNGKFHGSGFSSANDGPWGTGESFASYCAHSRGRLSEALLFGKMQQLWPEMLPAWWVT
jgi:hypothetical protein